MASQEATQTLSAMGSLPVIPLRCANWAGSTLCGKSGSANCSGCKLVVYCGKECQKSHWPEHKKVCKSPLSKPGWRPAWDREGRAPAWASGDAATNLHNPFGGMGKYLWGNVPAIDILQLERNEGNNPGMGLALLFAASGDLRNVVKTIKTLPEEFEHRIKVTINDRDFHVVARNIILLLVAITSLQDDQPAPLTEIAESLIHIWYSAFITAPILAVLQTKVKPMISAVCKDIRQSNTGLGAPHTKTWQFRSGLTLEITLQKKEWLHLEKFLDVPRGLTFEDAKKIRAATVMAPERADYRDRWYYKDVSPSMRLAKQRFREDGLLLPFGHPRLDFDIPNPTMFQTGDIWPMGDQTSPLSGWAVEDVNKTVCQALSDLNGKLFAYLRNELGTFLHRLGNIKLDFQVYCHDVNVLPSQLDHGAYSRIEVSNITDPGPTYPGTATTLTLMAPLLQSKKEIPSLP